MIPAGQVVIVHGGDYEYEGILRSVFPKASGEIRCVVEDYVGRLFIHRMEQVEAKVV